MTPEEKFIDRLDRYGADFSRWPADDRRDMHALIGDETGEIFRQYSAARHVEAALRSQPEPAGDALFGRIMEAASALPERMPDLGAFFGLWARGLAATAISISLLAGLAVGWSVPDTATYSAMSASFSYEVADMIDLPGINVSPGLWGVE